MYKANVMGLHTKRTEINWEFVNYAGNSVDDVIDKFYKELYSIPDVNAPKITQRNRQFPPPVIPCSGFRDSFKLT